MSIPLSSNVVIVVPTLNAAANWPRLASALLDCIMPEQVLILDSCSTDGTPELAFAAGFPIRSIPPGEFDHGGTRQLAAMLYPETELLIYLTQDTVLAGPNALEALLRPFADPQVAAAFGRQLPQPGAGPLEAHARLFNYPSESNIRTLESRKNLGFKAIFISNSFAAYRRDALMAVGGFPTGIIFGEDTVTAAKFLLAGWKVAYVAEAQVFHSHSYSWRQDFKRYFDIGVLHAREKWLLEKFGGASGEGHRFVLSELAHLWPGYWWLIPSAIIRTAAKFAGYRLGRFGDKLSTRWKRHLSMHPGFWK